MDCNHLKRNQWKTTTYTGGYSRRQSTIQLNCFVYLDSIFVPKAIFVMIKPE